MIDHPTTTPRRSDAHNVGTERTLWSERTGEVADVDEQDGHLQPLAPKLRASARPRPTLRRVPILRTPPLITDQLAVRVRLPAPLCFPPVGHRTGAWAFGEEVGRNVGADILPERRRPPRWCPKCPGTGVNGAYQSSGPTGVSVMQTYNKFQNFLKIQIASNLWLSGKDKVLLAKGFSGSLRPTCGSPHPPPPASKGRPRRASSSRR